MRGMTIHALLDDDGSDLQAQILASCETYRVPVVVPGRRTIGFGLRVASVLSMNRSADMGLPRRSSNTFTTTSVPKAPR